MSDDDDTTWLDKADIAALRYLLDDATLAVIDRRRAELGETDEPAFWRKFMAGSLRFRLPRQLSFVCPRSAKDAEAAFLREFRHPEEASRTWQDLSDDELVTAMRDAEQYARERVSIILVLVRLHLYAQEAWDREATWAAEQAADALEAALETALETATVPRAAETAIVPPEANAATPTDELPDKPQKRRRISDAKLLEWHQVRVATWPKDRATPSREQDWLDFRKDNPLNSASHQRIRKVRDMPHVPEAWHRRGRHD